MYWLIILISILKIGSRRQRQAGRRMRRGSSTPHCTPAVPRGTAAPRFFPPNRGSRMSTKLQPRGVYHVAGGGRTADFGRFPAGCARHTPDVRADPAGATRTDVLA